MTESRKKKTVEMKNVLSAASRAEFRAWLEENHDTQAECWLEVKRGRPADDGCFYYLDAVEEALCFGWIDSTSVPAGEGRLQRFSPRRKSSPWTELNKERVRRLEKLGLMTPAGRAVLPPMGARSFKMDEDIASALKKARCYAIFRAFPPLYQRVRAYNAAFFKKRDPAQYEKALAHLIEETKKGRMFGEWNDYGRLLEYENGENAVMRQTVDFLPSEHFPKDANVPQRADILAQLALFGIPGAAEIRLIDSTHDENDIRLNYIIDKKWVLRFCRANAMNEKRLSELSRLIARYLDFGLICPRFIADGAGKYLHPWENLVCYLSEYVDLQLASELKLEPEAGDALFCEVQRSVAAFAQKYKNIDLSDTMGMYSLFDLSPFDMKEGIDEKQQNFNKLIALLRDEGENAFAEKLINRHEAVRAELKAVYKALPRCVFQGDENFSNILMDNGHFAGFIDFNLAGCEVVVNQFVNIASFDHAEKTEEPIGAAARLDASIKGFHESMAQMLEHYEASEAEKRAAALYAWIAFVCQWPVFCYFKWAMKGELRSEILELIGLIAEMPEELLMPR